MKKIIFTKTKVIYRIIDGYTVSFYFTYLENKKGFFKDIETNHTFIINISRWALTYWGFGDIKNNNEVIAIAFPFAVEFTYEKVNNGTLKEEEEFMLSLSNGYNEYPYDLNKIKFQDIEGFEIKFEAPATSIDKKIETNKVADSIITYRDNINALFYEKYKDTLLKLTQERSILQLFRSVNNEEEFKYALSALANLATNINSELLRKITGENKNELKSIGLLEIFLNKIDDESNLIIKPLRNINRIRQSFPIHSDLTGVIQSLKFFNISYPVENYNEAWKILIENYRELLKKMLDKIKYSF